MGKKKCIRSIVLGVFILSTLLLGKVSLFAAQTETTVETAETISEAVAEEDEIMPISETYEEVFHAEDTDSPAFAQEKAQSQGNGILIVMGGIMLLIIIVVVVVVSAVVASTVVIDKI